MFGLFERGKAAVLRGAFADLLLCSLLFAFGAVSGAYSGSFSPPLDGDLRFLAGDRPFYVRLLLLAAPGAASAVFASSLVGAFVLPLMSIAVGFFAGYVASVCVCSGGPLALVLPGNWQLMLMLPFFVALAAYSLRLSRALAVFFFKGTRPDPAFASRFLKYLLAYLTAAVLALMCQTTLC